MLNTALRTFPKVGLVSAVAVVGMGIVGKRQESVKADADKLKRDAGYRAVDKYVTSNMKVSCF